MQRILAVVVVVGLVVGACGDGPTGAPTEPVRAPCSVTAVTAGNPPSLVSGPIVLRGDLLIHDPHESHADPEFLREIAGEEYATWGHNKIVFGRTGSSTEELRVTAGGVRTGGSLRFHTADGVSDTFILRAGMPSDVVSMLVDRSGCFQLKVDRPDGWASIIFETRLCRVRALGATDLNDGFESCQGPP